MDRRSLAPPVAFRLAFLAALTIATGLATTACDRLSPPVEPTVFRGSSMGTTYEVKVVEEGRPLTAARREELQGAIDRALETVDRQMSTYRPDSEVSRFNRHRTTEPFPLSAETRAVVAEALAAAELTGGAFDVTVGPLVDAWGFGPDLDTERLTAEPPDEGELAALRRRVGWRNLSLGEDTLAKTVPDLHLDLSGVAKGYAVDLVAEALEGRGVERYMVEVGGEVRVLGRNSEGQVWRIGIERPVADGRAVQRIVPLPDVALATSGDYRNYREVEGERISHIIDPRTGRPIRHRLASVSVVDALCARADALATGLMVLGAEEGHALAERAGIAALFLVHDGEGDFLEMETAAFRDLDSESPSR